jgi:hypothetical protein
MTRHAVSKMTSSFGIYEITFSPTGVTCFLLVFSEDGQMHVLNPGGDRGGKPLPQNKSCSIVCREELGQLGR